VTRRWNKQFSEILREGLCGEADDICRIVCQSDPSFLEIKSDFVRRAPTARGRIPNGGTSSRRNVEVLGDDVPLFGVLDELA
jgi:hypothetical protein